jgi:hypothetical protein
MDISHSTFVLRKENIIEPADGWRGMPILNEAWKCDNEKLV